MRGCPAHHDPSVEEETGGHEGDNDTFDQRVDRPHISREVTGKENEGDLEHDGETLGEGAERPFLETVAFAPAVAAPFNH